MTPTNTYDQRIRDFKEQLKTIGSRCNNLSMLRLTAVLGAVFFAWCYFSARDSYLLFLAAAFVLLFFVLMKLHQKASQERTFIKTLLQINEEELAYITQGALPFGNGAAYQEEQHAYAGDLDILGPRSLYQHLNRTATQMGKDRLAKALLHPIPSASIPEYQQAAAAWASPEERHTIYALGKTANDEKETYKRLLAWTEQEEQLLSKPVLALAYLLPALLVSILVLYAITRNGMYSTIALRLFPVNLLFFSFFLKRVRATLAGADKVHQTLQSYAAIFRQIERSTYSAAHLQQQQQRLQTGGTRASEQIRRLGKLLAGMETVYNPFSAICMNGLYLYHIHTLQKLVRWKQAYAGHIAGWLEVIGEMELAGNLANFHFNNPQFCFPELNTQRTISFRNMGHPLIPEAKRICNDVSFTQQRFMILTGSNMSGKSTFLRSLGINMVLARMGAPVCAASAGIHPLPVYVSMRQSDSLADNESYFFAEVKRLRYIISMLGKEQGFVLLDEILRGTNSDDKRSGTIGVIEKIIALEAIGAIATHDLEVCHTTDLHPDILVNKCFEAEITNNELRFDYKLRDGICRNKSATFLMQKEGII